MFLKNGRFHHKIHILFLAPRRAMGYKQKRNIEWGHMPVHCILTFY